MTTKLLRTLMGMVALVAMLTACSSEDVLLDEPNAKNEITFNVTTNRASRAETLYNSETLPEWFNLAAYVRKPESVLSEGNGTVYISNDLVERASDWTLANQKWINKGGLRYWPNDPIKEVLDIYAVTHADENSAKKKTGNQLSLLDGDMNPKPMITGFTVYDDAEDQVDLIYASAFGQNFGNRGVPPFKNKVDLNFHHALSQVVFNAQCHTNKLKVQISKIEICGTVHSGNLTLPTANSTDKICIADGGLGTWTVDDRSSVYVNFSPAVVVSNKATEKTEDGVTTLDYETTDLSATSNTTDYAFMLIPDPTGFSPLEASDFGDNDKMKRKAYFKITCEIWNIANPTKGWNNKDVKLYDGILYVPFDLNNAWHQGKRYTYTIIFGTGNAGYDESGKAAIVPMTYLMSADNWQEMSGEYNEQGSDFNRGENK